MYDLLGRPDFASAGRAQENCFLLANGLGGYCALSAAWSATRGDHALLMACTTPPAERLDLVHRLGETLTVGEQSVFLSTQDRTGAEGEDGWRHLALFDAAAPRWVYDALGVRVTRRVAMAYGQNTVAVQYTVQNGADEPCTLAVTPWLRFVPKGGRLTRRRRFAWGGGVIESGGVRL